MTLKKQKPEIMATRLLTPKEMAKALSVTERTLVQWRCKGTGPEYIKLGPAKNAQVRYLPIQKIAEPKAG